MDDIFSLKNKVIVITGGFGLIGQEVCDAFAASMATLVILDLVEEKKLESFANELTSKYNNKNISYKVDITSKDIVDKTVSDIVKRFKKIDVLINLAAIDAKFDSKIKDIPKMSFEHFPLDIWKKSIDTNITGTFIITQSVIKQMINNKNGNIINVASTYSLVAPNQELYNINDGPQNIYKPADYVISKSVIPSFSRYLATFYGKLNIRANTIVPHGIYNNHSKKFVNNFNKFTPLGRMCDLKEIRGPFIFLASNTSSYMTGSTLVVDGGWTAW
jgi:NAD(P)-dependent dehydrogenase (short-subunit alcohol dehydrogenase family)